MLQDHTYLEITSDYENDMPTNRYLAVADEPHYHEIVDVELPASQAAGLSSVEHSRLKNSEYQSLESATRELSNATASVYAHLRTSER